MQANLLAAMTEEALAVNQIYNGAVGDQTTPKGLHAMLARALQAQRPGLVAAAPGHRDFRAGDLRHSRADIGKAARQLGFALSHDNGAGLAVAAPWFRARLPRPPPRA